MIRIETIGRNGTDRLRFVFMAVAVLTGALVCAKVARSRVEPKRAQDVVAYASAREGQDPNAIKPFLDKVKEVADALKKKNLFVKEQPKQHPVKQIDGILGNEVLIGDKWYKVGEKIGDAEIMLIGSTQVTIQWDGKKKAFAPLASAQGKSSSSPSRSERRSIRSKAPDVAKVAVNSEVPVTVEAPVEDDPLAWMGVDLPPKLRAMFLEKWNTASDEEKEEGMRQWNSMPEEEKQQVIEAMSRM